MYRVFFAVLRRLDPEIAHHAGIAVLRLCGLPGIRTLLRRLTTATPTSSVSAMGLTFASPLGVAAGFDKNAEVVMGLWALGFDHVEVGTITPRPQPGNDKPRLFRLLRDRALINRMGFNNDGVDKVTRRLARLRGVEKRPVIGVNIGKNRDTAAADAVNDYRLLARKCRGVADYLVINISSPNTPGLRDLGRADALVPLVRAVLEEAGQTPVLVKLSPDQTNQQLAEVSQKLAELPIAGIIATNTTVSREELVTLQPAVDAIGDGGLSGRPLASRASEVTRLVRESVGDELCLVSVGGVESGFDLHRRIAAGATLVQLYTAFVYRGPGIARAIRRELAAVES